MAEFTAADVAASIARLDGLRSRCDELIEQQPVKLAPIKPDMSLPRHRPPVAPVAPNLEPQVRFDRLRRGTTKAHDYPHICGGSFGDDVDAAFEACSNAPC